MNRFSICYFQCNSVTSDPKKIEKLQAAQMLSLSRFKGNSFEPGVRERLRKLYTAGKFRLGPVLIAARVPFFPEIK
jgi:hypothetical protein